MGFNLVFKGLKIKIPSKKSQQAAIAWRDLILALKNEMKPTGKFQQANICLINCLLTMVHNNKQLYSHCL